jgi:DNA-binding beta-propeller fold protein YncE
MRIILAGTAAVVLLLNSVASGLQGAPAYKQIARFVLGGEGGWDYLILDPDSNRLFIAHNQAIYVADANNGKKLAEISADGAHGIALVQEKNRGFISNGRAGTVTAFDLQSLQPLQTIKAGENPDAIIYDPYSREVIVMNGRTGDVMVIDPTSMKVIHTIPLGGKLEFAAADAGHVYVNIEDKSEIADLDSKTWNVAHRWQITGCEEPSGLAIDRKQKRLFAACDNKTMAVVDASTGHVIASVPTGEGTDGAAFDPELNLAFASNGEGTLTVVRQRTDGKYERAENVATQRGARTIALDPSSHRIFLPTAELGPRAPGERRPGIKPGTFVVLVYAPEK